MSYGSYQVSRVDPQFAAALAVVITFNQDILSHNGLACPYAKSNPERYKNSDNHPVQGWKEMGKLR